GYTALGTAGERCECNDSDDSEKTSMSMHIRLPLHLTAWLSKTRRKRAPASHKTRARGPIDRMRRHRRAKPALHQMHLAEPRRPHCSGLFRDSDDPAVVRTERSAT